MGCNTSMEVYVDQGPYKLGNLVDVRCGTTNPWGDEYRCVTCAPNRPWYICKHGNDISDYMCGQCEGESYE